MFSNLDGKVRHAMIRIYIKQLLPLKLANVLVALLLASTVWEYKSHLLLIIWLALHLLFIAIELFISHLYKRHILRFHNAAWIALLGAPTLLVGLLWGSAVPLFMDASNPLNIIMITILLLGVLSGSLYTLSLLPPLFHLFALMVLLPFVISLYTAQGMMTIVIAALLLSLFFACLSYHLYRITYDLLLSRDKNKAYAHELKNAKQIAEQASAAKTRFLASASHDIRQPLQAIALYIETLSYRLKKPENKKSLEALKVSQQTMTKIMDSLLDISKLDAGIVEPNITTVRLQPIITHVADSFQLTLQQKGGRIRIRSDDLYVHSDPMLLERMLINLMSNAVRYSKGGDVLIACRHRAGMLMLEVWDTGMGIPEAQIAKVFYEFYQLNNPERDQQKGLGLGLAIVQRLTLLLPQHRIELCSRLGQGSRFRLTLPAAEPVKAEERFESRMMQTEDLSGMQVLVIEDDQAVRQALIFIMQAWECQAIGVDSAKAAIAQIEKGWVPDAIVADYRLPDRETGVAAIAAIRALLKQNIPTLIVTGESLPETLQDIQAADVLMLHKPVLPNKLKLFLKRCN